METARDIDPYKRQRSEAITKAELSLDFPAQHEILTADEEQELAVLIEDGVRAALQLEQADDNLDDMQRARMLRAKRQGDEAKQAFIHCNQRLVMNIANRFNSNIHMEFNDLVQEGNLGLIRAVEKFDYRKGFKFSTYATWWIRQAIKRAIDDKERTIHIPNRVIRTKNLVEQAENELKVASQPATVEAIAELAGLDPAEVEKAYQRWAEVVTSVDTAVAADAKLEFSNLTPAKNVDVEHEVLISQEVERLMSCLDERQARVVTMYFGLDGNEINRHADIANELGISRDRIKPILDSAFKTMYSYATDDDSRPPRSQAG